MAFRMQTAVPEVTNLADESKATLERYGKSVKRPGSFARNCLIARKLCEKGVRFIQLFHPGWDHHMGMDMRFTKVSRAVDKPAAALLQDLDERVHSRLADTEISELIDILAPDFRQTNKTYDSLDLNSLALHENQRFDNFDLRNHELMGEQRASLAEALAVAQRFAENQEGWLIFTGTYHCGKTHLAAAIAYERLKRYSAAPMFVFVPDLLDYLRAAFNPASTVSVSYTHLRAHETVLDLVCRLLLEKKKKTQSRAQ